MYALKTKGKWEFSHPYRTEAELNDAIKNKFLAWSGIQPKGSNKTIEDYMQDKVKVKISVEKI